MRKIVDKKDEKDKRKQLKDKNAARLTGVISLGRRTDINKLNCLENDFHFVPLTHLCVLQNTKTLKKGLCIINETLNNDVTLDQYQVIMRGGGQLNHAEISRQKPNS